MYYEISINVKKEQEELVCEFLFECGAMGTEIKNSDTIKDVSPWAIIDGYDQNAKDIITIVGFFDEENINEKHKLVMEKLAKINIDSSDVKMEKCENVDWLSQWKMHYKPIEIDNIAIVPSWIEYSNPTKTIIFIQPKMAFGTGEHESTRLCITLLQQIEVSGKTVVDVGTGSGILAICALKIGATFANMYDIDEHSIINATENLALNNLLDKTELFLQSPSGQSKGDIVFANLTAGVICEIKSNIISCVNDGGYLIMSGIIKERLSEVQSEFLDFELVQCMELNGWCGLMYKKPIKN